MSLNGFRVHKLVRGHRTLSTAVAPTRSLVWSQRKLTQLDSSLYMTTSQYMIHVYSLAAELAFWSPSYR